MESANPIFSPILVLNFPVLQGKIPFWEDFYLKAMMQMRRIRLEIPHGFAPQFLHDFLIDKEGVTGSNGFVSFFLGIELPNSSKTISKKLFTHSKFFSKDFFSLDLWSYGYWDATEHNSIELNHPLLFSVEKAKQEIQKDDLVLLNKEKSIARTLLGNLFLKTENQFLTNKIEDGAWDDVARDKFIVFLQSKNFQVMQTSLKSYQIQQAESVFVSSNQFLLRAVSSYKRKKFDLDFTHELLEEYGKSITFDDTGFF